MVCHVSSAHVIYTYRGLVGGSVALLSVLWCTWSATYLFTAQHMADQRLLVAYPLFLFYACFALLTVF